MKIKHLIFVILAAVLMLFMMNSCTQAHASLLGPSASEVEAKQRLSTVETQLYHQRHSTENWAGVAGALAIGSLLLLIVGTALGSLTRRHYKNAH
jgi:hypothetical protein